MKNADARGAAIALRSAGSSTRGSSERRAIGAFDEYARAEQAVDTLSDRGFPVERVTIVGTGLRYVEQVAGRTTTGRAALAGASQGAVIGVVFALLFGMFFAGDQAFFGLLVYSVVLGVVFGAILRAVDHAARGGRRDFASTTRVQADRYEVQVDGEVAERAAAILRDADLVPDAA